MFCFIDVLENKKSQPQTLSFRQVGESGPTDSTKVTVNGVQSIQDYSRLCWDMKHKNKTRKSSGRRPKKRRNRDQKQFRSSSEKLFDRQKLKRLAMASGFQGSCINLASSSSSDDDIVVVYDKQEEKHTSETKFCLSKQFDVNLQNIPLPPKDWVSNHKMNHSIRLEDIPLPPSPNTYERLQKEKHCNLVDFEAISMEKLIKDIRKWELTELGKEKCKKDKNSSKVLRKCNSFTVMSYNVLAQKLLEDHNNLYRKHSTKALQWKYRSAILLKEIQDGDADILCLQEVQASHLESFYRKLEGLGYRGLYKQRSNGYADGCAIYYKTDKFKLIDSTTVEYFQDYLPVGCILDRNNVAVIARLALQGSIGPESEVVVATTHLLYNPKRHDVKLAQTQVLLAELDRMSYIEVDKLNGKPKYLPVIMTGDFNLKPNSAVYRLITNGSLRYSELTARSLTDPYYGQALQDYLLPFELQISSSCQHLGLMVHRLKKENSWIKTDKTSIPSLSKLYNSDVYKTPEHFSRVQAGTDLLYEEDYCGRIERGCLHHNFNFLSVYKHERQTSQSSPKVVHEATTHQDDWITVDYIFYSGEKNQQTQDVEEGTLKLLSRYTLPTRGQCEGVKTIPNAACGSDHFSLIAQFCLSPKED